MNRFFLRMFLFFFLTLWLSLNSHAREPEICKTDKAMEIRFTAEQIRFGPAASWALRYALSHGGKFTLTRIGDKQLQVVTTGWSGIFAPMEN